MPSLCECLCNELSGYYQHLGDRIRGAVQAAGADLWRKPYAYGNSVGHLVLHITGNLNHYIGARIAGTGYVRNRELEFTDDSRPAADVVIAGFDEAMEMVVATLVAMDESRLTAPYPGDDKLEKTNLGMLILCVSHMNNHIGQMVYLIKELKGVESNPPVW